MRVSDKAKVLETLENAHELSGISIDVIRKDVFIDRAARRRVDAYEAIGAHAHRKIPKEFPAVGTPLNVWIILKLLSRPETCRLGAAVEIERLIEHREIVIS